ncbi:hypothetical protein U9M48_029685 [Paspalum notatum var. saurae]|uniref:BTB domain-containing protein n=1 Tax=Paspalum notatum var. saurae TaxID=547442 RepID=A0AAQ3U1G0_PASNO
MGKAKSKGAKFAVVKKIISKKTINKYKADVLNHKKKDAEKEKLGRNVPQVSSALFFSYNTALGPPYRVIVDTNFINFSIQNKLDLEKGMMDCLYAKCTPCITDCVMAELEKLGQKYRVALRIAKDPRFQRLACTHKGTYADDCIVERVTQHKCYIVATCDKDLKRRIRKVPGVPIMYITRHRYSIERLPEATIGGELLNCGNGLLVVGTPCMTDLIVMKLFGEIRRTASMSGLETARGTHVFKITRYSLHKGIGVSNFFRSATFSVGPSAATTEATGQPMTVVRQVTPKEFAVAGKNSAWGTAAFMKRSELESPSSPFLHDDDCLVVECDVTVVIDRPPVETPAAARRRFSFAHRAVLAAWSPIFNAELFGPMAMAAQQQQNSQCQCSSIDIHDMQAGVFRALLHFVYTVTMPAMEDLDADDRFEMAKHLLVPADRYAVERLKLMCEAVLCRSLGVENVATMWL